MITIYLARAVGKDTPEVYQARVADDGLFGTHPKAAPAFLTALLQGAFPRVGGRVFLSGMAFPSFRNLVARSPRNSNFGGSLARGLVPWPGGWWCLAGAQASAAVPQRRQHSWVLTANKSKNDHASSNSDLKSGVIPILVLGNCSQISSARLAPRAGPGPRRARAQPGRARPTVVQREIGGLTNNTTLQRASNTVEMHTDSQKNHGRKDQHDTAIYTRNQDRTENTHNWTPQGTRQVHHTRTELKRNVTRAAKQRADRKTDGGIRGYNHNDNIGSPTTADIPDVIEGVDNYLVGIQEETMPYMGASQPLRNPAQLTTKTQRSIENTLTWHKEEGDALPVQAVVMH
eukprot:gene8772-biopygen12160